MEGGPHAVVCRVDPSALLPLLAAAAALSTGSKAPAETREEVAVLSSWQISSWNEGAGWEVRLF